MVLTGSAGYGSFGEVDDGSTLGVPNFVQQRAWRSLATSATWLELGGLALGNSGGASSGPVAPNCQGKKQDPGNWKHRPVPAQCPLSEGNVVSRIPFLPLINNPNQRPIKPGLAT